LSIIVTRVTASWSRSAAVGVLIISLSQYVWTLEGSGDIQGDYTRRTADVVYTAMPGQRRRLTFPALLNRDRIIKGTNCRRPYGIAPRHAHEVIQAC